VEKPTVALDPATVTQANRSSWRRVVMEAVIESARLMCSVDTTTAERVRLASLIELLTKALESV